MCHGGKYINHKDAYLSVVEALHHAGIHHDVKVNIRSVETKRSKSMEARRSFQARLSIRSRQFLARGIEERSLRLASPVSGKFLSRSLSGNTGCGGGVCTPCMQSSGAHSRDGPRCANPVIHLMEEQMRVEDMGGMRLGTYPCELVPGTNCVHIRD